MLNFLKFGQHEELSLPRWRKQVLRRASYKCQECGEVYNVLVHHKIPTEFGGKNTLQNGKALCPKCHRKFHGKYYKLHRSEYEEPQKSSLITKILELDSTKIREDLELLTLNQVWDVLVSYPHNKVMELMIKKMEETWK